MVYMPGVAGVGRRTSCVSDGLLGVDGNDKEHCDRWTMVCMSLCDGACGSVQPVGQKSGRSGSSQPCRRGHRASTMFKMHQMHTVAPATRVQPNGRDVAEHGLPQACAAVLVIGYRNRNQDR